MSDILSQLRVIIGLEAKGFAGVQSQMRGFTNGIQNQFATLKTAVAGYFTTQFAVQLGKSVAHMAERWKDLSEQTGESTDEIQRFDAAFKKVGLTAEDAAASFDLLAKKRDEALSPGGGNAAKIFQGLGLSESDIAGKSGAELFRTLASMANDPSNQVARAAFGQLFGTRGNRSGKLLAGASEIAKGGGGSIMSAENIRVLDEASKRFERAMLDFKVSAAPFVVGATRFATSLVEFWRKGGPLQWLKQPDAHYRPSGGESLSVRSGDSMATTPTATGGRAGRMGWQLDEQRQTLMSALDAAVFKTANPAAKKSMLQAAMNRDLEEARRQEALGNYSQADALRAGAIKQAGDLAAMNQSGGTGLMKRDSMAAVGGLIGGASYSMDPSLSVQQEQLNVLREILRQYPELIDAMTGRRISPISQIR